MTQILFQGAPLPMDPFSLVYLSNVRGTCATSIRVYHSTPDCPAHRGYRPMHRSRKGSAETGGRIPCLTCWTDAPPRMRPIEVQA
jgi:hypothetical protein